MRVGQQHSNPLCLGRNFQIQQLLDRQAESQVVGERREVIHPIGQRDALRIGERLKGFLKTRVEVTDVEKRADDRFPVELENQAEHAVRRGMLGPQTENDPLFLPRNLLESDRHLPVSRRRKVFAKRMTFPIFREENASQKRVTFKLDSHQVAHFALEGIGARPNRHDRVDPGIFAGEPDLQPELRAVPERTKVIDDLKPQFGRVEIDRGDIGEVLVIQIRHVPEEFADLPEVGPLDINRHLTAKFTRLFHGLGIKFADSLIGLMRFERFRHDWNCVQVESFSCQPLSRTGRNSEFHRRASEQPLTAPIQRSLFPNI